MLLSVDVDVLAAGTDVDVGVCGHWHPPVDGAHPGVL
jgi:hypothetical protein